MSERTDAVQEPTPADDAAGLRESSRGWTISLCCHHDSREVTRQIVASFGATVRVAQEGYEALELAATWTPDLILCDLMMPGMDGFTLMGRLKADPTLRAIRVVAVSVLAGDADLKRTWLAGFDGHIVKPIDYDLLAAPLERVFWAHRRV
jgi:CheY-like chemotaxis protein